MNRIGLVSRSGTVPTPGRHGPMRAGTAPLAMPARGYKAARRCPVRRGYMLFEVQVAFLVLGIGLAGLCPLLVMQLRQVRMLEMRLRGQVTETSRITGVSQPIVIKSNGVTLPTPVYYIVPWKNPWAQKLAGSAQILPSTTGDLNAIPCDPGQLTVGSTRPQNTVSLVGPVSFPDSRSATAYVDVTLIP
jgi:hypothetical protein